MPITDPAEALGSGQPRRPVVRGMLRYLRSPRPVEPHDDSPRWRTSLKLLGLDFVLLVPLLGLSALAAWGIDGEAFTADEGLSHAELFLLGVIVAPLIEEAGFRLFLAPMRTGYLVVAGFATAVFFLDDTLDIGELMLIPGIGLIAMAIVASRSAENHRRVSAAWESRFGWAFYGSAVAFGLIHIFNYGFGPVGVDEVLLAPLLIAPQMGGALVLGYVRVRLGFWNAVANHAAFNAVMTIPDLYG
jgi:membrane protease YdiL (CAAX protease family)